jgi:glycosyltransferase involved in cell wall biosynthesis
MSGSVSLALAPSKAVAADAKTVLKRTRIEVLENSVDTERFNPKGPLTDLAQLSGLPPPAAGTMCVGLVATFARWKGQDLFLQAIAQLPSDLPVRFYIVGGPVYATTGSQWTLTELAALAGSDNHRVGFTGWCHDVPSALRSLDIVVHASTKPEPFGLVIVQAIACGKCVIVSGEGGAAEIVRDLPQAFTFEPRSPQSLAKTICDLVASPEKRCAAAVSGPLAVKERFSPFERANQAALLLESISRHAT